MPRDTCITDVELIALNLGEVPEIALADMVAHLDSCRGCEEKARQYDRLVDPFLATFRQTPANQVTRAGFKQRRRGDTPADVSDESSLAEPLPQSIAGYEIISELGRGGMGVVYLARQGALNRLVALKRILVGTHASLSRFCAEAESAARLQHPNLVQIYEIGWFEELPYMSMEFVDGCRLEDRMSGTPQPPLWSAEMVEILAQAIHVAHQHQVIHRDLKPANVLLTPQGQPKITDFGVAKQLDSETRLTNTGIILGTPSYMAPEQAKGEAAEPATDVYSLGVILYELLTGRVPFEGPSGLETLQLVLEQEPVQPRQLQPKVPRDLQTICLKCLQKEPRKRYRSAASLADDLRRFRNGEPILARPTRTWERLAKWTRRQPIVAALLAAVVLVTLFGFGGIVWKWRDEAIQKGLALKARNEAIREREAKEDQRKEAVSAREQAKKDRDKAIAARDQAETSSYFSRIAQAQLEWRLNHDMTAAASLLDRCQTERRGWEWHYLQGLLHTDLLTLRGHTNNVVGQVAFSPNGRLLASSGGGNLFFANQGPDSVLPGEVIVRDAASGKALRILRGHEHLVPGVTFGPDGRWLASASNDKTLRIWEVASGRELHRLSNGEPLTSVACSPDGKYVAAGHGRAVTLWDPTSGQVLRKLTGHGLEVIQLAVSPDGRSLASGTYQHHVSGKTELIVWDTQTWQPRFTLRDWPRHVEGIAFSPDSRLLAAASGTLRIWETDSGRLTQTIMPRSGDFLGVAFSPDGELVASAGSDRTVRLWSVETGKEQLIFRGHKDRMNNLAFHPTGRYLASSGGGEIKLWDLTRHPEHYLLPSPFWKPVEALAFSADGRQVLALAQGGEGKAIDVQTGSVHAEFAVPMTDLWLTPAITSSFDAQAHRFAAIDRDNPRRVNVWDVEQAGADTKFTLRQVLGEGKSSASAHQLPVYQVVLSGTGRHVATAALGVRNGASCREIKVWDAATGQPMLGLLLPSIPLSRLFGGLALSPDGKLLAFDDNSQIKVCDVAAGDQAAAKPRTVLPCTADSVITSLAFSGDGRLLVSADESPKAQRMRIWDLTTGQPLHHEPIRARVHQFAFSPDGRRLAGVNREELMLWDVATGQEILGLHGAPPRPSDNGYNPRVAWSSTGQRLAVRNWNNSISVWDITDRAAPAARSARRQEAEQRAPVWHLRRAAQALERADDTSFAFHWKHLQSAPLADPSLQRGRGLLSARQGMWQQAATDYAQALARQPVADAKGWLQAAAVQLLAGDFECYRRLHERAPQVFTKTADPETAQLVLRLLALSSQVAMEPEDVARLAKQVQWSRIEEPWLFQYALAQAHHRAGKYKEALKWCQRSLENSGKWKRHQLNWLVLALAHQRLGNTDEARVWLDRTEEWLQSMTAGKPGQLHLILKDDLNDGLELLVLYREATALIRQQRPD